MILWRNFENYPFNNYPSYNSLSRALDTVYILMQVAYRAYGFLEKNRDTLSSNMQKLMEQSHNNLVNELFTAKVLDTGTLDMR